MIEVRNLHKNYGSFQAVKDLSFSVGKNQVMGLLGPNGAGKTTVMRILAGCRFPSAGEVLIDGHSMEEDPEGFKKRIGYLPENAPLYGDLSVEEFLSFAAQARGIPRQARKKALEQSLDTCGLVPVRSQRIETLSRGFKQRTGLAQAVIHDPPILILDEPSSALDPNQIIEIRSLLRELGKQKTLILSTHILQEAEAVCSQVLILNEGRLAAQGAPGEIAGKLRGGDTWELVLKGAAPGATPGAIREKLSRLVPGGPSSLVFLPGEDGNVTVRFFISAEGEGKPGGTGGEWIFDWAVSEGLKVLGMNRKTLSLEDIFVKLTGGTAETGGDHR